MARIFLVLAIILFCFSSMAQEKNRCGEDSLITTRFKATQFRDWNDTTQFVVPRFYTKADYRNRRKTFFKHPGIELKYFFRKHWRRIFPYK